MTSILLNLKKLQMSGSNKILENHFHFKIDTEHFYVFFIGINNIKKKHFIRKSLFHIEMKKKIKLNETSFIVKVVDINVNSKDHTI